MDITPSNETVFRACRKITSTTASGNATASTIDAFSQEESGQAMTTWSKSSILPFAQQRDGQNNHKHWLTFPIILA